MIAGVTHYSAGSGVNADGSSYRTRHCASRRFYGRVLRISYGGRVIARLPCTDKTARKYAGRVDLPDRIFDRFFGPNGRRRQPRGGYRCRVSVVGRVPHRAKKHARPS